LMWRVLSKQFPHPIDKTSRLSHSCRFPSMHHENKLKKIDKKPSETVTSSNSFPLTDRLYRVQKRVN
jgi:hypothetical protein